MELTALVKFIPLVLALGLAYMLVMKQGLPSKNIGSILSYFLGIIIVFVAIRWLITSFFAQWMNSIVQDAQTSTELQEFTDTTQGIFNEAFGIEGGGGSQTQVNTQTQVNGNNNNDGGGTQIIYATTTPNVIIIAPESAPNVPNGTGLQHTVATGDTLSGIAQTYGSNINDIMIVNGLTNYIIHPGDVLIIPPSQ